MELCTGRITVDAMDEEVAEIARLLDAGGFHVALVTYGFPHSPNLDDDVNMPVAMSLLPDFLEQREDDGIFHMGYADLFFKTDCGTVAFLLCELLDIHCYTKNAEWFDVFSRRWAELYPEAYEADRTEPPRLRPLAGNEWRSFRE